MKKASKVVSIILSAFMLMQMMTGVVFAASDLPTDLHWGRIEDGDYNTDFVFYVKSDRLDYKFSLYKDNKLIDCKLSAVYTDSSEIIGETCERLLEDIIKNGPGSYTAKIGILEKSIDEYNDYDDEADVPVVAETPMSEAFVYAPPANRYPAPENVSIQKNILTYDYDKSEPTYHMVKLYVRYSNGNLVQFGGSSGGVYNNYSLADQMSQYRRTVDRYNNYDPAEYDKTKAEFAVSVTIVPSNVLKALPSEEVFASAKTSGQPSEDNPIDRTVISEKCYNGAKVCYDLGLMPKIYENYNQNVTGSEFNAVYKAITGRDGDAAADSELTYSDIIVDLVDALGYAPAVDYNGGRPTGSFLVAFQQGITDGGSLAKDSKVTYEQLAQLVYNSLECPLMKQTSWGQDARFEITDDTLLYKLGYSKYTVNAEISGDSAAVKGKMYNKSNLKGADVAEQLAVKDSDIKTYADKGMTLYVKDGSILSGIPYYYARVKINNGDKETTNKKVSFNLEVYGYSKYKIGDGEYSAVPESNAVEYTLDPVSGSKTVNVSFANADESKTTEKSASITLVNKHKVTYKVNGEVFETVEVDCGSEIPKLYKTPSADGFRFDGWDGIPETMPDEDIVINAIMTDVSAAIATGKAGESATWAISQEGVLTVAGTGAVSDLENFTYGEDVKSVIIGDGITSIGDYALNDFSNCETVKIGKNVSVIGVQFMYGTKVSEVIVPANVTEVKESFCGKNQSGQLKVYVYNMNLKGCENITEGTLYGYTGSTLEKAAKDREFVSIDPDFEINGGAAETADKNVKITLNGYAVKDFKQYKINDGEYKNIDGDIDYVLDVADGDKTINITFKNENCEIVKTHVIKFNNKHKIIFKADGKVVKEIEYGCGAPVSAPSRGDAPEKEGYVFLEWHGMPLIIPDSDVVVNALYLKNPGSDSYEAILTEDEIADGVTVKTDVTVVSDNENINSVLVNKYSKYTASIIINIDVLKGKDESFERVTETNGLLAFTVDIPEEIQGKAEYIVLREHDGAVDALTTSKNTDGEYIEVKDNTIIIHAKKFSAYQLIAKDADPKPSRGGSGGRSGSLSLTVKFETNGAPAIKPVSAARNTVISEPAAPVKEGYVFDGWYTDKNFTAKFDFGEKLMKSVTLYAKWTEKAKTNIILTIGEKDAVIDGKTVSNDVAPKIVNDRAMLPIRFIAEALGAKVEWFEDSRTVKISDERMEISLVIGESFAMVNGERIDLDSPSFVENDRTYLPIRFVTEKLGADVKWDDESKTVTIVK